MSQAKTLTEHELKILLAVISQGRNVKRNRLMMLMSYWAGMRVGEIAALKIGDVLNENGTVKDEIRLTPEQTKGNKARTVMLGDKLCKEIANYCSSLKKNDPTRPLIASQKSRNGFSANSLSQEFKKLYERAGISGATSHSGRRSFITNLANKGIGVRVLQSLAGHSSIATTQLYIDVNDEMKRVAVNLI
jgi:integrase/recombinase XerD